MSQRFTHIAVTVPKAQFAPGPRGELLSFYEEVFGWTENPGLSIPGERIFLRAPRDDQYLNVRASDDPMQTSGYEHLGVEVESVEEIQTLHARCRERARRDPRVVIGDLRVEYAGRLHSFRVRYLLPITIEVQYLERDAEETT